MIIPQVAKILSMHNLDSYLGTCCNILHVKHHYDEVAPVLLKVGFLILHTPSNNSHLVAVKGDSTLHLTQRYFRGVSELTIIDRTKQLTELRHVFPRHDFAYAHDYSKFIVTIKYMFCPKIIRLTDDYDFKNEGELKILCTSSDDKFFTMVVQSRQRQDDMHYAPLRIRCERKTVEISVI